MHRLDVSFPNGNKLAVIHDGTVYCVGLLWMVNKRSMFATSSVTITLAELRSLIESDYAHVDVTIASMDSQLCE